MARLRVNVPCAAGRDTLMPFAILVASGSGETFAIPLMASPFVKLPS